MRRVGFKMKIKPGLEQEYKKRHDEICPELVSLLASHGLRDYTIFLDPDTGDLFAMHRRTAYETVDKLMQEPLMRKWFTYNSPLMDCNADDSPIMKPLLEVFHMD
jgi:L-rhamnose mutarotase